MKNVAPKQWFLGIFLILLGLVFVLARPASAGTQPQVVYQTPTARPDGRVVYIVQEGDTCLRIQLLTGTSIETLRQLNRLDQACTIAPKQELLLKVITPQATFTPNPKVTSTPLLPTLTPVKGNGNICVTLYNDVNGDAVREDSEPAIAGGAVSITSRQGNISKTLNTTDTGDPQCVEVPEGTYHVSMGIPGGYNPTVVMDQQINLLAGDQQILEFGAQASTKATEIPAGDSPQSGNGNTLLAIMGGLLVVAGIGLGGYAFFNRH